MFNSLSAFLSIQRHFPVSERRHHLMAASTIAIMLLPAGCTATGNTAGHDSSFFLPRMEAQEPSQRSELIFAQLKLQSALSRNDREAVINAAGNLIQFSSPSCRLNTSSPIIEAAVWLLSHKEENEAAQLMEKASVLFHDDLPFTSLQADLLIQNNKKEEAIDLLRSFTVRHPGNGEARAELALALLRNAEAEKALDVFRNIPVKNLTPQIRFSYAQALNSSSRFSEAEKQLREAVKEDPENAEAWQLLGLTLEELGRKPEAESIYRDLLQNDPNNRSARLFLLRILLRRGDMNAASDVISASYDPLQFAAASVAMFVDEKQLARAEKFLELLEGNENIPEGIYFYHAAFLYETSNQSGKALSLLEHISLASQEYEKALRLKIRIEYKEKNYSAALRSLNTLQELHPDEADPLLLKAEIHTAQKDFDAAEKAILAALHLQKDNESALLQQAYLEEMKGNRKKATALMEKIIEIYPDNALALNFVGYNLAESNQDLDRACALIERAAQLEPHADFILDSLAWVYFRKGDLDKAWKYIQTALKNTGKENISSPEILEHCGDIALARGDKKAARTAWQKALLLFEQQQSSTEASRVRKKLDKLP